ncbi:MAG: RNA-binding protein [Candidatus Omnitrophica bacterium]|jgi:RNA recognition motif-containing protein|nr:RNA-binding protein [Candidatus Omnitrophota bacterium]
MEEEKKLYIGNLEFGVTDADLKKFMEEKGLTVKEVKIISDKFSGRSKGFGFAEFDAPEQAQQAIDVLNGQELNGRALRVSKAQKMRPRKEGFGGGGGGRGGFGGGFRR